MVLPRLALSLIAGSMLAPAAALAQADVYRDDRSGGAAIVESYYNAINRKDLARAWGYFGDEDKPAASFEAFAEGFAETDRVELVTGPAAEEGAAGSTFFSIPVAIRATDAAGTETVFAGCYTARLANTGVQEPPFTPLQLVEGSLSAASEPLEDAVPAQCGNAPAPDPQAVLVERAKALFAASHGQDCAGTRFEEPAPDPDVYPISFRPTYAEADAPLEEATLIRIFCDAGAYNELHVFYLATQLDGLREVSFAEPDLDIRYQDNDSEKPVEDMRIVGFTTTDRLMNSDYVAEDYTISAFSKWRGIADASSTGLWLFRDGEFVLVKYEVDATYDGEINPQTVLDYYSAP